MKLLTKAETIVNHISRALFVVACIALVFVVVSVLFEVVMRYFFNNPTVWVGLASVIGLAFATFLSAAWVQKKEEHVKMDLVFNLLSTRNQALLGTITSILTTFALLIVAWYSGTCTWGIFLDREMFDDQPFDLLKAPFLVVVSIGSFMLALQMLRRTFISLQSWRYESTERDENLIK